MLLDSGGFAGGGAGRGWSPTPWYTLGISLTLGLQRMFNPFEYLTDSMLSKI